MPEPLAPDRAARWRFLAEAFLLSRAAILVLGVVGVATFADQNSRAALDPAFVWHKWDVLWYERVAEHGYAYELDTAQGQAAAGFFPLYPLVIAAVMRLAPAVSFFWAGTIVSNIFTLTALALIAHVLTDDLDDSRRALLIMMTAAGSFYLSIPYTEGLFLLLVAIVMTLSRRQRYIAAGAVAGLAAITRVQGLALIAVPVVACVLDRSRPWRERAARLTEACGLFAIPLAAYLIMLSMAQGSATAFISRQALWSNPWPVPFAAVAGLAEHPTRIDAWIHAAFWALYVWLLIRYRHRMPPGEALFCLGALIISTQQDTFHGIYRYTVPLVPLALAIGRDDHTVRSIVIGVNLVIGTLMILAFVAHQRLAV
jgi:hypothetical protein